YLPFFQAGDFWRVNALFLLRRLFATVYSTATHVRKTTKACRPAPARRRTPRLFSRTRPGGGRRLLLPRHCHFGRIFDVITLVFLAGNEYVISYCKRYLYGKDAFDRHYSSSFWLAAHKHAYGHPGLASTLDSNVARRRPIPCQRLYDGRRHEPSVADLR